MAEGNAGRTVDTLADAGFTLEEVETSASGRAYVVEVPQADSWRVYFDYWKAQGKNPDETLTQILNAQNEQGAKQGNKSAVRDAIGAPDASEESIAQAIAEHKSNARTFVLGAPRGGGGARHSTGLTQKQRNALGTRLAEVTGQLGKLPTQADIDAIYAELGIDPEQIASG